MEAVGQPSYHNGVVRFTAITNGCARAQDFTVAHTTRGGRCDIEIKRLKADQCRKAPALSVFEVNWHMPTGCSLANMRFVNPPVVDPLESVGGVDVLD